MLYTPHHTYNIEIKETERETSNVEKKAEVAFKKI